MAKAKRPTTFEVEGTYPFSVDLTELDRMVRLVAELEQRVATIERKLSEAEQRKKLYRFVVPAEYHCDNHTPGDVFTVRLVGEAEGNPGWFYVKNIHTLDEFPVQLSELEEVRGDDA